MYIVSYISKAERELGLLLKTAQKQAREHHNMDAIKELRTLGQIYVHHREVTLQLFIWQTCLSKATYRNGITKV